MSLRRKLNQNSSASTVAALMVIVLAVGLVAWQFWPSGYSKTIKRVYYTNDEGQSWFADDIDKPVPFDKDGKPAYRAQVVQCKTGKPFVAFVMRSGKGGDVGTGAEGSMEYRKPGAPDSDWGVWPSDKWKKATDVTCPDGSASGAPVLP